MRPLAAIRRLHAPLACLAIACIVSAGCSSRQETLYLGQPFEAYRADNGAVVFGYYVEPTIKPGYTGWHWLVVEPEMGRRLMQALPAGAAGDNERTLAVSYQGRRANAELIPPLDKPGLEDPTPPALGVGPLTEVRFIWDADRRGIRLLDGASATLPIMRVSPDSATLKVSELRADSRRLLRVLAVVALVGGLIVLGGDVEISSH